MKVIFLDLDGVLNSVRLFDADDYSDCIQGDMPGDLIEIEKLNMLKTIIKETGAVVVYTTSWMSYRYTPTSLSAFLGIPGIDKTWCTGGGLDRGKSVLDWIDAHPEVESYIILDDGGTNMYESYEPRLWLPMVWVHGRYGIQPSDVDKAIHLLNNPPSAENIAINTKNTHK